MYTAIVLVIKLLFGVVLDILADGNCPLAAIKIWKQGFLVIAQKCRLYFMCTRQEMFSISFLYATCA